MNATQEIHNLQQLNWKLLTKQIDGQYYTVWYDIHEEAGKENQLDGLLFSITFQTLMAIHNH